MIAPDLFAGQLPPKIDRFRGEYRFLSNFWYADVEYDDVIYKSNEHAFVAAKTLDLALRAKANDYDTPGEVKAWGRTIPLRPGWDDGLKLAVMEELVRKKFAHPQLAARLLATGDADLIEGNTWNDTFWGVCRGRGENHLGRILMKIRAELRLNLVASPHRH